MSHAWLALALLFAGSARGQAPSYSAANIVNAANGTAGPFAPNSILTIYGDALARSTHAVTADDIQQNQNLLPTNLDSTTVYVGDAAGGVPAPLLFISPKQVNFVLPGNIGPDPVVVRLVREGLYGPAVTLILAPAAPALFTGTDGYLIASHADYQPIASATPAHGGEVVVLWATGLGKTVQNPKPGELPNYTSPLADMANFQVTVAGVTVDSLHIQYAGLTPLSAALYQINLVLPDTLPPDPEVRCTISGQTSPAGPKLAAR